jgi:serine/threonine-protein kinase
VLERVSALASTDSTGRQRTMEASSSPGSLSGDDEGDDAARRHGPEDGPLPEAERAFGPYTLLQRLAFGGMGEVFLARRDAHLSASLGPGLARLVVVKRILAHMRRDEKQRRAFVDEARLQLLLRSNNIVQVEDVGEIDGQVFLAMEHVHGPSLRALIDSCRRARQHIPLAYVVDLMVQAADAMSYAHNLVDATTGQPLHIVHRDVNPHNILVTYDGEVKLIDFGIAKSDLREQQTETGTIKGKFAYMSPEQSAAEPLDARSDLFALGICFYELVTLVNPFKRGNVVLSLEAIQRTTPALPSSSRRGASIVDPIIERMLRKDPDDRFADCGEVADALRVLQHDGLVPAPREPLPVWLRSRFAAEIQQHRQILEQTGGAADLVVPAPRATRPPTGTTGSFTASRSVARPAPAAPPTFQAPEDAPALDAPPANTPALPPPGMDPGTASTGALAVRPRRGPALTAAAIAAAVAVTASAAWLALRPAPAPEQPTTSPTSSPSTIADAGIPTASGAVGVVDSGHAVASAAPDAGPPPAVDAGVVVAAPSIGAGAVDTDAANPADAGVSRVESPRPSPRDPPRRDPLPVDVVARIAVTNSNGFVVKGPRTVGQRQPTLLVVDDRDAPFKLRLRLRANEAGEVRLAVESEPWGILRVDQVGRGRTPVNDVAVSPGRKTVLSLQNPAGAAMELALTVTPVKP